jgi:hypothetical protein
MGGAQQGQVRGLSFRHLFRIFLCGVYVSSGCLFISSLLRILPGVDQRVLSHLHVLPLALKDLKLLQRKTPHKTRSVRLFLLLRPSTMIHISFHQPR